MKLIPFRSCLFNFVNFLGCEFGDKLFARWFFAAPMRKFIKVDTQFYAVNSFEQFLKGRAQMRGTFLQGLFSVEYFTGNTSARFGGAA
jgi:hypothetical protein